MFSKVVLTLQITWKQPSFPPPGAKYQISRAISNSVVTSAEQRWGRWGAQRSDLSGSTWCCTAAESGREQQRICSPPRTPRYAKSFSNFLAAWLWRFCCLVCMCSNISWVLKAFGGISEWPSPRGCWCQVIISHKSISAGWSRRLDHIIVNITGTSCLYRQALYFSLLPST